MIEFQPIRLPGRWREGYALDVHTVSSAYLGEDELYDKGRAAEVFALTITRTRANR